MKLDGLKYGKEDGNRDEKVVEKRVETKKSTLVKPTSLPQVELPSDYTKSEGEISVRILFILSGGEDRERNYFKMLKDDRKLERIKVAFASKKGQGLNPAQLLEVANKSVDSSKFVTEEATYRFEKDNGDIIYLLQDIDEFDKMIERKAAFNKEMMERYRKPIVKNVRYDGEKIRSLIADFTKWAEDHPLRLPGMQNGADNGCGYYDNRAFPLSYKVEKTFLDDNSGVAMPVNTDELYMENIQNEIYHYYHILFVQNRPTVLYTIDFSEIKDVINLLGLDGQYAILSSFYLDTFDTLYGGEPLRKTVYGYEYKGVPIYKIRANDRFMVIMRKEYLPKAEFKPYEGDNGEYEQIDGKNFIYSNIHQMKDLGEHYGLSVMRVVKFQLPPKGSFKYIRLNIVDHHKEQSEIGKLSKVDAVGLQYEEGDIVRIKAEYRNGYSPIYLYDNLNSILKIEEDGTVVLDAIVEPVSIEHIEPVPINGTDDSLVYYDPFIAASFIGADGKKAEHTVDYTYYLDQFKRDTFEGGKETLYDKCMSQNMRYVHEVQHWLRDMYSWDRMLVKHGL